ncbi:MAG TPA: hypothetical protein VFT29_15570 [Gemmatimonadaceae bacterium]|nr:hypothetical protein [Gemmatimonadaceae bacterium]
MSWRFACCAALLTAAVAACRDQVSPAKAVPAKVVTVVAPQTPVAVGASAGPLRVRVTDALDKTLSGVVVNFAISLGTATLSRSIDTTSADGIAETQVTVGTAPALNEVSVLVSGVAARRFQVAGVVGPTTKLTFSFRDVRLPVGRDAIVIGAAARDAFNNLTNAAVTWTTLDPSLLSSTPGPNNTATLTAVKRPGQTYAMATAGGFTDSVLVSIPDASAPCAFGPAPASLPLGGTLSFDSGSACVIATDPGAEFVLVAHYSTPVSGAATLMEVLPSGSSAPQAAFPTTGAVGETPVADPTFEQELRARERREIGARVAGARAWYDTRQPALSRQLREGDLVSLNVNARDFCGHPDFRAARVVAITDAAVVLADTANPEGGFTDEEYREFGMAMDTLVNPVDTAAFGAPSDIDNNGKVGILFTRAVNALTAQGSSGGIILGFYYVRDLLPRFSPFGDCAGSNMSEMFYTLVPDPNGAVNGNVRTKSFVRGLTTGTIGHEYQHLINASRRMYINRTPQVDEETWLNEGLSHIAEELIFYRASGRAPKENIGTDLDGPSVTRNAFEVYQRPNFSRYREYLRAPETNSPITLNDALATRGASWAFLRYLADRARTSDGDFWRQLVNSRLTGIPNIDDVLQRGGAGFSTMAALSDWSMAVLSDETAVDAAVFRQPSWNFVTGMPAVGLSFTLTPRILADGIQTSVSLLNGGTSYLRFAVPQGQEAFIRVTGNNGTPLAPGMRLTIARIK